MIYELRVYRVVQGRMAALLTRFKHQTLPIMVRHGILQVGFWTTIVGRSEQHLTYLLAWESLAQRQEQWDALAAVFIVMNFVVLPHTAVVKSPLSLPLLLNGVLGHALFVGLPIALSARRSTNQSSFSTQVA